MTQGTARHRPAAGLLIPWLLLAVLVVTVGDFVPPLGRIRNVARIIGWEMLKRYDRAAPAMAALGSAPDPRLDAWRQDLYRSAGMSALLSGDFTAAADWFGRIAGAPDPLNGSARKDYFALIHRGIACWKAGRTAEALRDWDTARESMPDRHDAWLVRGHSRLLSGDSAGAAEDYSRAMSISGKLGVVHVDIGDAWRSSGRPDLARETYRRGLAVDPADVFCRLRLAEMALEPGNDPAAALESAAVIRRMMPTLRVVADLERAALAWRAGNTVPHIPAARFEPGPSRTWKISPTKVYFEFFREDWHGW